MNEGSRSGWIATPRRFSASLCYFRNSISRYVGSGQ
jgi:hypothetical protein